MAEVVVFGEGGYRYIKAVFQYSGGVAATAGFALRAAAIGWKLALPGYRGRR